MRVLDVGSGVGDVAILAARIVGTAGSVTACDLDEKALAVLRERAASEGLANISTLSGDLHALALPHDIDAVTGRHILIHLPDPLAIVRLVSGLVKPGGVVVFQEYDFSVMHAGFPPTPLRDRTFEVFRDFFAKARHGNMGTRLPVLFAAAGLTDIGARRVPRWAWRGRESVLRVVRGVTAVDPGSCGGRWRAGGERCGDRHARGAIARGGRVERRGNAGADDGWRGGQARNVTFDRR
jgi:SAM-dependent methyltransferase